MGVAALGATEFFDIPPVIPLAAVVGVGVLLGGIRHLGAGRDILAVAAVFVLLLAGQAGSRTPLHWAERIAVYVRAGPVNVAFWKRYLTFEIAAIQGVGLINKWSVF